jgi:hypothetical protein
VPDKRMAITPDGDLKPVSEFTGAEKWWSDGGDCDCGMSAPHVHPGWGLPTLRVNLLNGHDERSPFFSAPASPPSPLGDDAGLYGEQVELSSLPLAPGAPPPHARGTTAGALPAAGSGPAQAPSPPLGTPAPQGGPGGEGHDPAGGDADDDTVPPTGQQLDEVSRTRARLAARRRNARGKRPTPKPGPGMGRIWPGGGGAA